MNVQERMKYLRKDLLNLTQEEFSKKINISRSNYANIEKGSVNLTERVISDICRAFMVNHDWIMTGQEPIFTHGNSSELNDILKIYEQLNDDNKKYLQGYVHRLLEEQEKKSK